MKQQRGNQETRVIKFGITSSRVGKEEKKMYNRPFK